MYEEVNDVETMKEEIAINELSKIYYLAPTFDAELYLSADDRRDFVVGCALVRVITVAGNIVQDQHPSSRGD